MSAPQACQAKNLPGWLAGRGEISKLKLRANEIGVAAFAGNPVSMG
jgi:hypothetical protein